VTPEAEWLYRKLVGIHYRANGLSEPATPAPAAIADDPPPDEVDDLSQAVCRVIEILAIAGVRPEPNESLAQALARALFDEGGNPTVMGCVFFGHEQQGGARAP
jgi:hypothetical protein